MKKILLFLAFDILMLFAYSQVITVSFTGQDATGKWIPLDSVFASNQTLGWTETLYWPDTVLTMQVTTGIGDANMKSQNFAPLRLFQNTPNPFNGTTDVMLAAAEQGALALEITDVNGRTVAKTNNYLPLQPGIHKFRIAVDNAGVYFLTARQNGKSVSIKMVCNGGNGGNGIEYTGNVEEQCIEQKQGESKNNVKGTISHKFNLGDQMEYIGYATVNELYSESMHISQPQSESEELVLQFTDTQYVEPKITTDSVIEVLAVTAQIAATVYEDGGTPVIVRGICWSTSPMPTFSDSVSVDSSGLGSFVATAANLEIATTYYVRAYATNSVGTSYGEELSFTTVDFPTVTTAAVGSVTTTQVAAGGEVTSDGGAPVSAFGVCWATTQNPTIADSVTTDGSGVTPFTSVITLLLPNTTYYVRAYATNIAGTAYGSIVSVKTPKYPTIVTTAVSNITATTAASGGNVTNDGGVAMVERGVCWSTSPTPTIADSCTSDGNTTGSYASAVTGLTPATTYFLCAYATNTFGTAYGSTVSFTTKLGGLPCTSTPTVTDYDNNVYNTLQVGTQCWMKENLRCKHYSSSAGVNEGSGTSVSVAYYYHASNDAANDSIYGLLYNWKAVMGSSSASSANPSGVQGICPVGWHIPSVAEITQLINYMGSQASYTCNGTSTNIAKALAATTKWGTSNIACSIGKDTYLNNESGYTAYPAGYYYAAGSFGNFGSNMYLWTTTLNGSDATGYYLRNSYADMRSASYPKYYAFSVRCVKD